MAMSLFDNIFFQDHKFWEYVKLLHEGPDPKKVMRNEKKMKHFKVENKEGSTKLHWLFTLMPVNSSTNNGDC